MFFTADKFHSSYYHEDPDNSAGHVPDSCCQSHSLPRSSLCPSPLLINNNRNFLFQDQPKIFNPSISSRHVIDRSVLQGIERVNMEGCLLNSPHPNHPFPKLPDHIPTPAIIQQRGQFQIRNISAGELLLQSCFLKKKIKRVLLATLTI